MTAEVTAASALGPADAAAMYALLTTYFDATSELAFQADLAEKDFVILLRDSQRSIRGFSTGKILEGDDWRAVYSGDTIIHHEHWGEQTLALEFAAQAGRLKAQAPTIPLYWFLITKGYRTYRYLPLFFHEYYPRWDRPTPAGPRRLLDTLAEARFGAAYQSELGVVRFPLSHGHLRDAWAGVRAGLLRNPDVRYFLEHNPGYTQGDELVCLAELSEANIRPVALRVFREALHSCRT